MAQTQSTAPTSNEYRVVRVLGDREVERERFKSTAALATVLRVAATLKHPKVYGPNGKVLAKNLDDVMAKLETGKSRKAG